MNFKTSSAGNADLGGSQPASARVSVSEQSRGSVSGQSRVNASGQFPVRVFERPSPGKCHDRTTRWRRRLQMGTRIPLVCGLLAWMLIPALALSQDDPPDDRPKVDLSLQVELLSDTSYHTRQLARWRLEQQPRKTIDIIRREIGQVDHHTGAQLVDLLTVFVTHKDVMVSLEALQTLRDTAKQLSSVGKLANNSLHAIADLQEGQAIEILDHHDAHIGLPDFNLNAQIRTGTEIALHIDERFTGDDEETIHWIRFLQSVETVFLEGPKIDSRYFRAISHLKGVRNIKLKHVNMTAEDLMLFRNFANLEHLGLNYVNIDDSALDVLSELPLSESLRLYGTQITREGAERLAEKLDGIEIYCGRGGFLGVATDRTNTIVTMVTNNSGAQLAGIQPGDRLTHINGEPIRDFSDLRDQLGKFLPNEKIKVRLTRGGRPLELKVTLTEEPTRSS